MKVLGLDLGTASIGWALIELDDANLPVKIVGLGSRIINLRNNEASDFSAGKGESVCSKRTTSRTIRKGFNRFGMRRAQIYNLGMELGMIDENIKFPPLNPEQIWALRSDAASNDKRLTPSEIIRVLLHINQRRGYRHAKSDVSDNRVTEYVAQVNQRYKMIKDNGLTVGQYFSRELKKSGYVTEKGRKGYNYRIKEQVLPRIAYEEEFDVIMNNQRKFYPDLLTEDNIKAFKNAIFYQRPLKSCKHLVSFCEFEKKLFKDKSGKLVNSGPRVAPASSPLAQVDRIYEVINNIRLVNSRFKNNDIIKKYQQSGFPIPTEAKKLCREYVFDNEERQRIFDFMFTHEKMTETDLLKLLGLNKTDGFKPDNSLGRGIQGNPTYCKIRNALNGIENIDDYLDFKIKFIDSNVVDQETGEIYKIVSTDYVSEPLYRLWHTLYSVSDKDELRKALVKQFGIEDEEIIDRLYAVDFVSQGYTNKSAKFMRKLIPLLKQGYDYAEASAKLGVNHSMSLTKEENETRMLKDRLELLPKNSLRQPTIEKILNQMINLVNAIKDEYGEIDEIRVELARELKQSKDERKEYTDKIRANENENKKFEEKIKEFGVVPSRRRIQKMKMLEETGNICMYCGQPVTPIQFIEGHDYEIEHIIPRSKVFNDSFSNKVCSCRKCNHAKNNRTAFDFMESRPDLFEAYINRVDELFKAKRISKAKRRNLLTAEKDIDAGFIERDLRLTQYVSRKARLILLEAFRNVYASSGAVTNYFRRSWGYDEILHDLNYKKYNSAGLTEKVTFNHNNQTHSVWRIRDWSKRKDHRHHALDALVIALTRQAYIQRLSSLNAESSFPQSQENIDKWALRQPHFTNKTVKEYLSQISVSFKAGKKLTTPGKRYVKKGGKRTCVQTGILVPRGELHKDTVYGKILLPAGPVSLAKAMGNPELIVDKKLRTALTDRFEKCERSLPALRKSLKNNPLYFGEELIDTDKINCFYEEIVVKYPIDQIKFKDINFVVDKKIRGLIEERFRDCGNNDKMFAKSLVDNPIFSDVQQMHQIRSVRLRTGINGSTLAVVRKDKAGKAIGFSQTRNNHHIAFYRGEDNKIITCAVSFWTAVKRKRYGIPVVVKNVDDAWDKLMEISNPVDIADIHASLPMPNSRFITSMALNEMFILGLSDELIRDAVANGDRSVLNENLFRVQKLSSTQFGFSHHTSTTADMNGDNKLVGDKKIITSYQAFKALNPKKVRIDVLGRMIFTDD